MPGSFAADIDAPRARAIQVRISQYLDRMAILKALLEGRGGGGSPGPIPLVGPEARPGKDSAGSNKCMSVGIAAGVVTMSQSDVAALYSLGRRELLLADDYRRRGEKFRYLHAQQILVFEAMPFFPL